MKIVYNNCYGVFSLSHDAILAYAKLKGLTLYPETSDYKMVIYWTTPPEDRADLIKGADAWKLATTEQRVASNEKHRKSVLYDRDIPRDDPDLVAVVEELGEKASGRCASLMIENLAPGTLYRITEYDGIESVETMESVDWNVAK